MRLSRPRVTIRRLMVLVALLGVLLGYWVEVGRLHRLSTKYHARAVSLRLIAQLRYSRGAQRTRAAWEAYRDKVVQRERQPPPPGEPTPVMVCPPPPELCQAMMAYCQTLEAKYRQAARSPWWSVEPNPPAPDPTWVAPK